MMIFDAVICNTDRHFGNFGLMVDNKTNSPISFAPLFDHGLSLLNYAMDDDLNSIDEYVKTRMPKFEGVTFEELVDENSLQTASEICSESSWYLNLGGIQVIICRNSG